MTEMRYQENGLQAAVFHALVIAKEARKRLYEATSGGSFSLGLHRKAEALERRLLFEDIFSVGDEQEFLELAGRLADLCQAESQSIWVHDEHCMSGGYERIVLSARGVALKVGHHALTELAQALAEVQSYLSAETITDQLLRRRTGSS